MFSLTWLFYKLYDTCQQVAEREFNDHERAFPVEGIAHQQLLRDVYNFSPGLACEVKLNFVFSISIIVDCVELF